MAGKKKVSSNTPWGGRFFQHPAESALRFSASIEVDQRLAEYDIEGSLAHVRMLGKAGVLSAADTKKIEEGLHKLQEDLKHNRIAWDVQREDVHMNLEALLTANIGEAGARLHTARSRNDQVATDMRLWTRAACSQGMIALDHLIAQLVEQARNHVDVLMPGYTHLQRAQPVRLAHHLLAWCEMFDRDRARLLDAQRRLNECPLGAGALATTTFAIDRTATAQALGFERPMQNSMDAVSDRDFLLEFTAALSICAIHLSRVAEELILWNSQEFGFITMSDAFTTGSSMMPQKKNPDMAELIRGKTGRVVGDLVTLLTLMKGLPLTYNRDMQEDKSPAFDAFDTVFECLNLLAQVIETSSFNASNMVEALQDGFLEATEIADYLTAKGVPFRDAHHVAGRLVSVAAQRSVTLPKLALEDFKKEHASFENDVFDIMQLEHVVERRNVLGGPAKAQVNAQLQRWKEILETRLHTQETL